MAVHLVTGGSGYFGAVVARRLRERGLRVRIFDLFDAADRPGDIEFVAGDIRSKANLRAAMRDVEVVHHNVAQVPLAKDAALFWSVNRDGTRVMLQEAQRADVRKVIYTSSSAVFGAPKRNPVLPTTPPSPAEEYGRAKHAGELICGEFVRQGLDVTIVRPRTIMGPGRLGIMQIVFEWIRQGVNVPVMGRGDNRYQFVHADDLADACIRAAEVAGPATFNVGTERFGTMRQTLESLIAHAGSSSRVRGVPMSPMTLGMQLTSRLGVSPLGPYHALMYGREMFFDVEHVKTALGWTSRFSNDEMFAQAYDWYVEHRDEVLADDQGSHHRSAVRQGALSLARWVL